MNSQENFDEIYKNLVEKYLERDWRLEDGFSDSDILKTEEKLSFKLPTALREYYKTVGNVAELNQSHNFLVELGELPPILFDFKNQPEALFEVDEDWQSAEDFLIFMTENQSVVYWGLKVDSISETDPIVWQIVNNSPPEFYSEKKSFRNLSLKCLIGSLSLKIRKRSVNRI